MTTEEWRPVVGFEAHYEVSNLGHVRTVARERVDALGRLRRYSSRTLSPCRTGRYPSVTLKVLDQQWSRPIHRLVAAAFLGERPEGLVVCHGNGDCYDNRAANLRYDTRSENNHDAVRHGTHVNSRKTHCPKDHPYNEDNTIHRSGGRFCRTCAQQRGRAA